MPPPTKRQHNHCHGLRKASIFHLHPIPGHLLCPEGPWSQATVLLPLLDLHAKQQSLRALTPAFRRHWQSVAQKIPHQRGTHHFSTFTRPPCSKVFLGEVTVSGLRCARSASQNFTWPSAEPLISNGGTAVTSKVKTAPVWPANVYKAFSNFCSKDQQIKYPSLEHVKRYLPSAETQTFRIGLSCRHMKLGAHLSSSCFFSRLCLRSNSCFRLFSMPCTAAAGRSAVMSWVFSKTSESPGSLPAKRVTSFKSKSFELILSCWFCARFSPVFTFSSNFKISRNFFANFKNSFSSSANADCFWYVDSARQLIGGKDSSWRCTVEWVTVPWAMQFIEYEFAFFQDFKKMLNWTLKYETLRPSNCFRMLSFTSNSDHSFKEPRAEWPERHLHPSPTCHRTCRNPVRHHQWQCNLKDSARNAIYLLTFDYLSERRPLKVSESLWQSPWYRVQISSSRLCKCSQKKSLQVYKFMEK